MIETLFLVNTPKPKPNPNEATRWQVLPPPGLDDGDKVLDPKKAQNIAILLKALHVTVDEVCEGLLEGIIIFSHISFLFKVFMLIDSVV